MRLQYQGIDGGGGGVGRLIQARGISDNDEGVGRGRGIYYASEGLETTPEAAGDKRRDQGIYDNNRGVSEG